MHCAQQNDLKRCRTHRVRSQVDDPEEVGVAAAARDDHIRHVLAGVQQGGVTVGF